MGGTVLWKFQNFLNLIIRKFGWVVHKKGSIWLQMAEEPKKWFRKTQTFIHLRPIWETSFITSAEDGLVRILFEKSAYKNFWVLLVSWQILAKLLLKQDFLQEILICNCSFQYLDNLYLLCQVDLRLYSWQVQVHYVQMFTCLRNLCLNMSLRYVEITRNSWFLQVLAINLQSSREIPKTKTLWLQFHSH